MTHVTIENFETIISGKILERGQQYYADGAVVELEEPEPNDFVAQVFGTELYSINIRLDREDNLFTHFCDCPYDMGPVCKHKVAVLLAIRDHKRKGLSFKEGNIAKIKFTLERYSKAELMQLIMDLAKRNSGLRDEVMLALGFEIEDDFY